MTSRTDIHAAPDPDAAPSFDADCGRRLRLAGSFAGGRGAHPEYHAAPVAPDHRCRCNTQRRRLTVALFDAVMTRCRALVRQAGVGNKSC
jgi:hypothetical protein